MDVYILMANEYQPHVMGVYASIEEAKTAAKIEIETEASKSYYGTYLAIRRWEIGSSTYSDQVIWDNRNDPQWRSW